MNVCTSIYQKAIEVILMNNDTKKLGAQDSKFAGTIDMNELGFKCLKPFCISNILIPILCPTETK